MKADGNSVRIWNCWHKHSHVSTGLRFSSIVETGSSKLILAQKLYKIIFQNIVIYVEKSMANLMAVLKNFQLNRSRHFFFNFRRLRHLVNFHFQHTDTRILLAFYCFYRVCFTKLCVMIISGLFIEIFLDHFIVKRECRLGYWRC